jgi:hypothetical protein
MLLFIGHESGTFNLNNKESRISWASHFPHMNVFYVQGLPLPATPPIDSAVYSSIDTAVNTASDTTGRIVTPEGMPSNDPCRSGDHKGS